MAFSVTMCRCVAAAMLACVAFGSAGCRKKPAADLVIVSPHNKKIQAEFERAFRDWHKAKFGTAPRLEWRDIGGTTSTTRFLLSQYERSDTSGIDLYFGGGAPDHGYLADRGLLQRVDLPAETLAAIPETIGAVRQYDSQGRWYGAALSCFGIIYNAGLLEANDLPIPTKWDDLADPAMFGRIEAADATQSGSARVAYRMIIASARDWPEGWAKLLKVFANCKRFAGGASDIPRDVANGEVLAGAAIDFYAYDQIALSGEGIGFTPVTGVTAFTPDPISLLKGAPHAEMGRRFIRFVLSERGQALWCLPAGVPGGPVTYALYRQPIRRDVYERYAGKMLRPLVNPFDLVRAGGRGGRLVPDAAAAAVDVPRLLGPLMKSAALDSRKQLNEAWKAIIDAGQPAGMLEEFASLPPDLATVEAAAETAAKLSDARDRELITGRWQRFFRAKYEKIIEQKEK